MTEQADSELIDLISREQRSLRTVMVAGLCALFLVVAMSVALGIYYYFVAQSLGADSQRLERRAFETRILADDLANRIADQETAMRRSYAEMLDASRLDDEAATPVPPEMAAIDFLDYGVRSLTGEQRLERTMSEARDGALLTLLQGTLALMQWERSGEEISRGSSGLPATLEAARSAFQQVADHDEHGKIARTGLAWIDFERAGSPRSNYALADCDTLFASTAAIGPLETLGPQPLYWRGQCARKLGRVEAALENYSLAVRRSQAASINGAKGAAQGEALLTLEMNAFHGLGTVLIAAADAPDTDALANARRLAEETCPVDTVSEGTQRTRLMHACLDKAISLRRALRMTENQVSGTRENLSFVYLIDNDFEGAFKNASAVEQTGLFSWNEFVRAYVADAVGAQAAALDARRNVSNYAPDEFNLCEIRKLLKPEHFEDAHAIFAEQHPDLNLVCG